MRISEQLLLIAVAVSGLVLVCLVADPAVLSSVRRHVCPSGTLNQAGTDSPGAGREKYRLLISGEPVSLALRLIVPEIERDLNCQLTIEVAGYGDTRQLLLRNARDAQSAYELVGFDSAWLGELRQQGVLAPLGENVAEAPGDFLAFALAGCRQDGELWGLPLQAQAELLWYRRDLFAAAGLEPPRTPDELLAAAQKFNRPEAGFYGIVWNGLRGQALGQTMLHLCAAFGQAPLDPQGRPCFNTAACRRAARFMLALGECSPPETPALAWDQCLRIFAAGQAAMLYGWTARSYLVDPAAADDGGGRVGYLPAPVAPGCPPVTPADTWSLGLPARLGARRPAAERLLKYLTSRRTLARLADNGLAGIPRRSLLQDEACARRYPAYVAVCELDRRRELGLQVRPAVPQWTEILGSVYHDLLLGRLGLDAAGELAQRRAESLFGVTRGEP